MCKITMKDDRGVFRTFFAVKETPNQILEHYNINPETKIVYMNGKILSREKMNTLIPETGTVHLAIRNKTVIRD